MKNKNKKISPWVLSPEMAKKADAIVQSLVNGLNKSIKESVNGKKKIWFIRHAESVANADENLKLKDFSGSDMLISEKGLLQAEELINLFTDAPDLVVTSPYVRTKMTAKHVIEKFSQATHEEWQIHEFTYLANKRCFNTSFAERDIWRNRYWQKSDPLYNDGEGAESFVDFMGRVEKALKDLEKRKEKFIVLFSHGYTIAAVKYILEKKPKNITSEVMRDFKKYFSENKIDNATKVEVII